ncbi:hypothetical protein JCM6882_007224 [Rhodosporidiobolus microsporus]
MCKTSATLSYGILVRTISLCLAAEQWAAVFPGLAAVELIKLRRRKGTLATRTSEGGVGTGAVSRVPEEVWDLVKGELVRVVTEEVERHFVLQAHEGVDVNRAGPPSPKLEALQQVNDEERYDLAHLLQCEACDWGLDMTDLKQTHEELIDQLLLDFGLLLPDEDCVSWDEAADSEFYSLCLITLNLRKTGRNDSTDTTWAKKNIEVRHGHSDASQTVMSFSPSFFDLPPNANARFKSFLSSGLTLQTGNFFSSASEYASLGGRKKRPMPEEQKKGVDSAGDEFSTDEPRWMLWNAGMDCGC